jgi:hypothetical protein
VARLSHARGGVPHARHASEQGLRRRLVLSQVEDHPPRALGASVVARAHCLGLRRSRHQAHWLDCSAGDNRRYAHREGHEDARYVVRYPLREWGWTRERCVERIAATGLPVPPKSACFFCPVTSCSACRVNI